MENSAVVVAVEAMLEKVARREGGLFCEELEEEVARGSGQEDFGCGLGLEVVDRGHFGIPL